MDLISDYIIQRSWPYRIGISHLDMIPCEFRMQSCRMFRSQINDQRIVFSPAS